jgi:hypothetical protein
LPGRNPAFYPLHFLAVNRLPASPLIARALIVAETKLGKEELCRRLVAPESSIRAWRSGYATMPEYKFLRLVDILTELDPSWNEWDALNAQQRSD